MTRNNRRTVLFAAALAVSAVAGAHAQGWGSHGHGRGHMLFGLLDGVTLTDGQQQQIHADMKESWQSTKSTRQQLRAVEQQLATTMTSSGNVSTATLTSLIQQEEALRATLDQARMSLALEIRNVLTAQQLAQAAQTQSQLATLHQQEEQIVHPGAAAE